MGPDRKAAAQSLMVIPSPVKLGRGVSSYKRLHEEPESMVHLLQGKMRNTTNLVKGRSRPVLEGTCPG